MSIEAFFTRWVLNAAVGHVRFFRSVVSHRTLQAKLEEFSAFDAGWSFGKGDRFLPSVVSRVRQLAQLVDPLKSADVFPGEDGSIALAVYSGEDTLELIVSPSLEISYHLERGVGFEFETLESKDSLSIQEASSKIVEFVGNRKCSSPELSTQINLMFFESDYQMLPLRTLLDQHRRPPTVKAASQYSTPRAPVSTWTGRVSAIT